jgi:hypothetical protein
VERPQRASARTNDSEARQGPAHPGLAGESRSRSAGCRLIPAVPGLARGRHTDPVAKWLERRTLWQFALILWSGALLCELLVFALLDWLGNTRFNFGLFAGLAVAFALVGMPGPLWAQKRRRERNQPPGSARWSGWD